jgi:GntR family transcriptional regulator/MocR family aminotransferase
MMVECLEGSEPHRLIHVTPSHQDPTGATLSLGRRLALLEIARRQRAIVVEDDYDSEFRYEGRPIESLQGLDGGEHVVYAGTFSKSVLAGLRLGYLILPPRLVQPFVRAKALWDSGTPMLEQLALAEFMRSGDFERHIRRMRRIYRSRRDALLAALAREFGERVIVGPRHGGLNVLVELDVPGTSEEIARRALHRGVVIRPATQYYTVPPRRPTFLLGFGWSNESQLAEAISLLGGILPAE